VARRNARSARRATWRVGHHMRKLAMRLPGAALGTRRRIVPIGDRAHQVELRSALRARVLVEWHRQRLLPSYRNRLSTSTQIPPAPAGKPPPRRLRRAESAEYRRNPGVDHPEENLDPLSFLPEDTTPAKNCEVLGQCRDRNRQVPGDPREVRRFPQQAADDLQTNRMAEDLQKIRSSPKLRSAGHLSGDSTAGSFFSGSLAVVEQADPPDRKSAEPQVGTPRRGRITQTSRR